ncbi:MAG: carboxypeptidase regulatory-like domain-containing protein [Acidobacteriota bacterium]
MHTGNRWPQWLPPFFKLSRSRQSGSRGVWLLLLAAFLLVPACLQAQIGGTGSIQGTVTDATGAVIPHAKVTALNTLTGVKTVMPTDSSGFYALSSLPVAKYQITVEAPGFEKLVRDNVTLNGLQVLGLNLKLTVGATSSTVTVTTAPPPLDTTNATLGGAINNQTYSKTPLEMGEFGQSSQRRATDVAFLVVGVDPEISGNNATDEPMIVNGNPSATEMNIDGVPFDTATAMGDPRFVWTSIPAESVNQFQVDTTGFSAEYGGLAAENFTIKSGTNDLHGTLYTIVRNTAFDASGFIPVRNRITGAIMKTPEHQWENGMNAGFPILKNKLFLFGSYTNYRYSSVTPPNYETIPTPAELCGDFSAPDAGGLYPIYDPTTQTSSTTAPTRSQFFGASYTPTGGCGSGPITANVIPQSEISPQAKYMQQFWQGINYANSKSTDNYIGTFPFGLSNWSTANRMDWDISQKQYVSLMANFGRQSTVNDSSQTTDDGPFPYRASKAYNPRTAVMMLTHNYVFSPNLLNQVNLGFAEYHDDSFNLALGTPAWTATSSGITNIPVGQASASFPTVKWSGNNTPAQWAGGATYSASSEDTWSFKDNVQWVHKLHSITIGTQIQWFSLHELPAIGDSTPLSFNFSSSSTGQFSSGTTLNPNTGLPLASYLVGAVNQGNYTQYGAGYLETFTDNHEASIYINDNYRVTPKLTLNLGLRWQYESPLEEKHNHFEYLNPNAINTATGTPGIMQFAGDGVDGCNCRTPVHTYYKDVGPRVGLAYALNSLTVLRSSFGIYYGMVPGGLTDNGLSQGGLQNGFSDSPNPPSPGLSLPPFYLNSSGYNATLSNSAFGGPGFSATAPPIIDPLYGTYYATNVTQTEKLSQTLGYLDPILGARQPEYPSWSVGFQRLLSQSITATVSYVGNEAHFLYAGNARGIYNNQMNTEYLFLQGLTSEPSTPSNVAAAAAVNPNVKYPYGVFPQAAPGTIGQMLKPFPQYSGINDMYSNVGNSHYNALQISITGRESHGFNFLINYTYSKTVDDDGTFRAGYAIPAGLVANEPNKAYPINVIDRSRSVIDLPQDITAMGTYYLPFGKGKIGGSNPIVNAIIENWELDGLYTYFDGLPLALTGTQCTGSAGTCEPSYNPNFAGNLMPYGKWGKGATAENLGTRQYINPNAFLTTTSANFPYQNGGYLIGNVTRTAPDGLRGPSNYDIDATLSRTFSVWRSGRVKFVFSASAFNLMNHVWFGSPTTNTVGGSSINTQVGNPNFGTITAQANSPRQFQFAGHINF